eukprot:gene1901-10800_t
MRAPWGRPIAHLLSGDADVRRRAAEEMPLLAGERAPDSRP